MHLEQVPAGALIVDTDATITRAQAKALKAAGVAGVVRCIGHTPVFAADNLSPAELAMLLEEGLAVVGAYQMWAAGGQTASLGQELGQLAVVEARAAGLLPGCMIALDLEGAFPDKAAAIAYVESWHAAVAASEFAPGVARYYGPGFPLSTAEIDALPPALAWRSASKLVGEPSSGYVLTQGESMRVGGVPVDGDHAAGRDKLWRPLYWIVAGDAPPPDPTPIASTSPGPETVPIHGAVAR